MDSLDELRSDLWSRWQAAFERFPELESASHFGERVVYANGELFDLKNYTPQEFAAGRRVFQEQPESINSYHRYRLDANGRPVHMASGHTVNHFDWEGVYRYANEEVEYLEYCLQTKVVSKYARMTLQDGIPRTYQKISVNGGGSHIGGATGKSAMSRIMQEPYFPWIEIEEYETSQNRILSGKALVVAPGQSPYRFDLEYSYSDAGKLVRIVHIREDGSRHTAFSARSKASMKELAAKLSERIVTCTIEALSQVNHTAPLQAVELSFRSVTNYLPSVIPAREGDSVSEMCIVLAKGQDPWIELNEEDFEPEMTEFVERMSAAENWNPGSKMLRQAASSITEHAHESLPVADGFVAFAIDWEFEGHDLPAILKQCGATAATLKRLREIGWLNQE
ncbi:MAG: hypothetical protein KGN79_09485 [Acidobacteriota bacterium]|nr:hypothetical protein [Acidobacteriota bacterium]